MKNKLLEKKKYPAACEYCKNGRLSPDEQTVLCVKKGLVAPDGKCMRYSYDPLKRRPKKPLMVQKADPSEFDLSIDTPEIPSSAVQSFFKEPEQEPIPEPVPEPVSEPEPESAPEPVQNTKSDPFFEPVKLFDENSDI